MNMNVNRSFDIIVWGATGFTGRLCVEYLAKNAPADLKWGIAGRSKNKLEDLKKLVNSIRKFNVFNVFIADSDNMASLDAFVSQTKIVLTTVGPFMKYGMKLVESCVKNHTNYIDSTGETPFVRKAIEQFGDKAKADGTILVPMSGFDSIPSDLGAFMIAEYLHTKHNKKTASVSLAVMKVKGGASGGTILSALNMIESPGETGALGPYALNPPGTVPMTKAEPTILRWNPILKLYQSLWIMEAVNAQVVRRSNALFNNAYGSSFRYNEGVAHKNPITALAYNISLITFFVLMIFPPFRWLVSRIVPPGTGPTRKQIEEGMFHLKMVGQSEINLPSEKPVTVLVEVKGIQDPGYGETAKMLCESCLACLSRDRLTSVQNGPFKPLSAGFLTPATAFGTALIERLKKAGMTFSITEI